MGGFGGDELNRDLIGVWEALSGTLAPARLERRDRYVVVGYPPIPSAAMNGVWSNGAAEPSVAELETVLAGIEAAGAPAGVSVRDGEAPVLVEAAGQLGFTARHEIPGMVAAPGGFRPVEVEGLELVAATDAASRAAALEVAAAGFGVSRAAGEGFYTEAMLELGARIYLGLAAGVPVTTALCVPFGTAAGIFNVATPSEHRGRGYGAAVTSRAAADAFAAGAEAAWLQASGLGRGVYRRLGFETVTTYELWVRPESGAR